MSRNSRFEHRDKRRKANMVLNILIGIVVVLILVVASSLLIFNKPKDPDVADAPSKTAPATSENKQNSEEDVKDPKKDTSDDSDAKKMIHLIKTTIRRRQMMKKNLIKMR